jgi:GH15 family glucan-1,4-alpha-glucosidase
MTFTTATDLMSQTLRYLLSPPALLRAVLALCAVVGGASAQTILLPERWQFTTGDDPVFARPGTPDAHWAKIDVPTWWERAGYEGYDGIAWYRVHFTVDPKWIGERMILQLGRIDDADETFLNGMKIGASGKFPPDSATAWEQYRVYTVPPGVLQRENVLAVRVYDMMGAGGIVEGTIGLWDPAEYLAEQNAPPVPRRTLHAMTTSNGLIAAVYDTRRGTITSVRPHIFQAYDSARFVESFAEGIGPAMTDERWTPSYRENTHVITARRGRLTAEYFASMTNADKILYVVLTGSKGIVDRTQVDYRPSSAREGLLIDSVTFRREKGEIRKYYLFGFTDSLHRDSAVVADAAARLEKSNGNLVEDEVAAMRAVIDRAKLPSGLTSAERALAEQSVSVLKMAQVGRAEIFPRSRGQILASLPPGEWNIAWVRDGFYATMALSCLGLFDEARKMLRFELDAESGHYVHYVHTDGHDYGIGVPYQISVCRYFGTGKEESDFSDTGGPNVEIDGFGLFLVAFSDYVRRSGDVDLLYDRYEEIVRRLVDPILHCTDSTGLIQRESGPWERHLPGKQFAYTSIACAAGLHEFANLCAHEHLAGADRIQRASETIVAGIRTRLMSDSGVIKGNAEATDPAKYDYYDGGTFEAFALGVFNDSGEFAAHLAAYERALRVPGERRGFSRINLGDAYETAEWVLLDLRIAAAMKRFGDARGARRLLDWVTDQGSKNFNLLPELLDRARATYGGAIPMVGFGSGAYILTLDAIHGK